jgi:hypothetical protein
LIVIRRCTIEPDNWQLTTIPITPYLLKNP